MQTVSSLAEAQAWFLRNPNKSVKCKNGSRWRTCRDLVEAVAWYGGERSDS